MNRTKIAFLFAAVFALTFTVEQASSASFSAVGALKQSIVGTNPVQKVSGCHTNCRWSLYRAGDGKISLGCHRNTWPALSPHLATREPAAGGTGGTDNPSVNLVSLSGLV
jgi:hypothetical protein